MLLLLELALVVMALYGVISFAGSQRRREIGLRMALGASSRSVITLLMREGLLLIAVGVALGVGVALLGGIALRSTLIGIGPADPVLAAPFCCSCTWAPQRAMFLLGAR